MPVSIALLKLHARSLWRTLTGRSGGLDLWGEDESDNSKQCLARPYRTMLTASRSQGRTIEGGDEVDDEQILGKQDGQPDELEDGTWYFGKAREDFNKRKKNGQNVDQVDQDDDDPVQACKFDIAS